ncbi:LysR family transcriptional regulator [Rhodanobacter sp. MP7CTX1]|uniref:LysR family transcriptional regulator n=1 Tax=Rhodanobacter sp. MP7CTX1 TaxID=2723084 RepID=UPI00160EBFC2|nr:LysR family transcriptional regulator [Rhodanobacter sp. MP7CTX1]MBB6186097.1 DNA-binding transcriptional LysR family regulator [Rhodanobacter sp. MP7CTX1]
MDRYAAMKIFVKVADCDSLAEAARTLFMSASAVTRAITYLEEQIGTRLFVRTTRALKITEAGVRYLQDCRRILTDIDASESAAAAAYSTPSGKLTVTAPELFGQLYVLPILLDFLQQHRRVVGHALFTNRVTDLVTEEIDVGVRIGHLPDSDYRAILVGSVRSIVCGSPSYFDAHGVPNSPSDLRGHNVIAVADIWSPQDWEFCHPDTTVTVNPRLLCSNDGSGIAATMAGWGLTKIMVYKIASPLVEGRLQPVLSEFEGPPLPIHALIPEGRHVSAKVKLFLDMLVERLRHNSVLN